MPDMTHTELIAAMEHLGIQVSPFMHYWTLEELVRYRAQHTP